MKTKITKTWTGKFSEGDGMASSCWEALAKKYLLANLTSARHLRWSHHKLKLRSPMVGCPKAQAGGLRKTGQHFAS